MTGFHFSFDRQTLRPALILLLFAAAVAALLGVANFITEEPIRAHREEKRSAAMAAVLPAEAYESLDYSGADSSVAAVFQAGEQGWVVEVKPSGFGGLIDMIVGIRADGSVSGVQIITMSETPSLGANAGRESFRSQYEGKSGSVALRKQGGEIDALTGATVTSTAVTRGVNSALAVVTELRGGSEAQT